MAMFSLAGRSAFVTGAGGGLGSAVAAAFARQGADVALADVNVDAAASRAAELAREHPDRTVTAVSLEVTDPQSVSDAFARARSEIGAIDVLANVAGIGHLVRFEEMTFEEWRHMLAVHLDGTFLCTREAIGPMLANRFGRIICTSSIVATTGVSYEVHYTAAKGGIEGMVRALAREVASRLVTVNSIAPGYFDTPLNDLAPKEMVENLVRNVPVGRMGDPAEIGALAVYLASNEAAYLTGQVISPNGCFSYGYADQQPI
ncbi:MAG: SDR family NAD(P)-dependent oxidoreductase [Acidimicrobiia bacterium]